MTEREIVRADVLGRVHSIETFGLVDGPGVRCVVFMQGCRMRCQYCHNPDTWSTDGGQLWTPEELFRRVYRYKTYWRDNGGITVSGGEALLQMEFVTEFFTLAGKNGVETALDTCGQPFSNDAGYLGAFDRLMEVTDLFILDIKEMDSEAHRRLTGKRNENILDMARYLSAHGKRLWIRHVLVPGLTDSEEGLRELRKFLDSLGKVEKTEILPYHTLGIFKWDKLGIDYPLKDIQPPTEAEIARAEEILGIKKA